MVQMHDKQALRTEIARLTQENAKLRAELIEARSQTGEARANSALLKEYADYKAHIARCIADFDAGVQRIHKDAVAECAKRGIKL